MSWLMQITTNNISPTYTTCSETNNELCRGENDTRINEKWHVLLVHIFSKLCQHYYFPLAQTQTKK